METDCDDTACDDLDQTLTWVESAVGSRRPIEALPYAMVTTTDNPLARLMVAIGDLAFDLGGANQSGLFSGVSDAGVLEADSLLPLLSAGRPVWQQVRARITDLLVDVGQRPLVEPHLVSLAECTAVLPIRPGDFVDFYSSREHAEHCGLIMRPDDEPLNPNWLSMPVGYHSRAGSVVVDGSEVVRPEGQHLDSNGAVKFGPTAKLDYELELGFLVGGPPSFGHKVPSGDVRERLFGVVLVNDWSARDIQSWEAKPIGPFLGKSFATSMSGWVLPLEALEDCRVAGPDQVPAPLPYLEVSEPWGLDIEMSVSIRPSGAADFIRVSTVNSSTLYWNCAQQLAHLTVNGASLRPGDMFASGTVSGRTRESQGCLLEISENGALPLELGDHSLTFLEDGDEVLMTGYATVGDGVRLDLGQVSGVVA